MRLVLSQLLALALLAGCVGPEVSEDPLLATPLAQEAPQSLDDWTRAEPEPDDTPWTRLDMNSAGGAGTWIALYQPFHQPLRTVNFTYSFWAESAGDGERPIGLFTVPPTLVGGISAPHSPNVDGAHVTLDLGGHGAGRQVQRAENWSYLSKGGAFHGVFALVGSTSAWTLNGSFTLESEPPGRTAHAAEYHTKGSNISLVVGSGAPASGPIGILSESLEHTAGWTHIELQWDPALAPLQHSSVRTSAVTFSGTTHGANTVDYGIPTRASELLSAWGLAPNPSGTSGLELTYAETTTSLLATLMHLPGADVLPGNLTGPVDYSIWKSAYTNEPVE